MKLLKIAFIVTGLALSSAAFSQDAAPAAAAAETAPDEASAAIGAPEAGKAAFKKLKPSKPLE